MVVTRSLRVAVGSTTTVPRGALRSAPPPLLPMPMPVPVLELMPGAGDTFLAWLYQMEMERVPADRQGTRRGAESGFRSWAEARYELGQRGQGASLRSCYHHGFAHR